MGLIKQQAVPRGVQAFSMADVEAAARAIIAKARAQGQQIVAEAEEQAAQIRRRAHEQGFEEGLRVGFEQGQGEGVQEGRQQALVDRSEELGHLATAMTHAAEQLDGVLTRIDGQATDEVASLSVAIASRLARAAGRVDPSVVRDNLEQAVSLAVSKHDLRIAINPHQRETVAEVLPRLRLYWPELKHVTMVDDASIEPGGCRVYTAGGVVDATLSQMLDRIATTLLPEAVVQDVADDGSVAGEPATAVCSSKVTEPKSPSS